MVFCGVITIFKSFTFVSASQPSVNNNVLGSEGRLAVDNELSIDFDSFNNNNDIGNDERVSTHLPPVINGHAGQQHQSIGITDNFSSNNNKSRLIKTNVTNKDVLEILNEPIITTNFENNDLLAILIKKQPHTVEQTTTNADKEMPAIVTEIDESSTKSNLFETLKTTLNSPLFTSGIVTEEKTLKPYTTKMKKVLSVATSDSTVKTVGFTSGHQNNFGIPIEEDERVLKMLDEYQRGKNGNKVM